MTEYSDILCLRVTFGGKSIDRHSSRNFEVRAACFHLYQFLHPLIQEPCMQRLGKALPGFNIDIVFSSLLEVT